jgi:hypothetical protein
MQKIALIFLLLFTGCATKEKIYAVIKTPEFRISDAGILKKGFGYKEVIIYRFGSYPIRVVIKNSTICLNKTCMDKETFIKNYLGKEYPSNFFDKILDKEPMKLQKGWIYKRSKNKVLFKNKDLLILIKKL